MALPPPWGDVPSGFALDGTFIGTAIPETRRLVPTLLVDEKSNTGGLYIVGTFCSADAWGRLLAALVEPHSAITLDTLQIMADRIVETHLGIPRWTVERLWQQAAGAWMLVDGEFTMRGIDLFELPAQRATNAVYALLRGWRSRGTEDELRSWQRKLEQPPLREIQRWKRDDVPVESASVDDMQQHMADLKAGRIGSRSPAAG
ncbi:hypothetical protein SEA_ASHERTHEMAN_32 [Gordonia phage Ashertheman]|uniref:Tail assembly chaperone n=6 Tax=Kroosvirus TaxID=2948789 RepID=A0A3G3M9G4_9CAUD|nr:hypothetical protein J1761_gp32 [Gordonia phage Kroos]YP_010001825.1 hypothetical protein J1764_gp32 [Gordonia phage Ashertheman]YP_010001909.1 hypothetical protein J1765_gp31 [Gordonia phage Gaea]YP_010001996.1 hypothetical protein J1766_gp32 [Gordonia phage Bizzy]YP_010002080.1 tail assembly chaperone [Gordonia phage Tangerine]YP_010002166.1 tail assembly chaperone [Gordonia phage Ribeye]URP21099.1 hypothetical protein SEA_FLATWOODS_32 [Gordonia phage Flatwoods]UTN91685.1 hypothetical p